MTRASNDSRATMRHYLVFAALVVGLFVVDIGTKKLVFDMHEARIEDGRVVAARPKTELIPDYLKLHCVLNRGAFKGMLAGRTWILVPLALIALIAFPILLWRTRTKRWTLTVSFGLLTGGTAGNLWDRVHLGGVRDFIEVWLPFTNLELFNPWPNFNIADSAISIGVVLLVLASFFGDEKAEEPRPAAAESD